MADKETLFIKCDCGKEHQLWDCDSDQPISSILGSTVYTFTCGPCGKLFNIQVMEKESQSFHEEKYQKTYKPYSKRIFEEAENASETDL